MLRDVVDAHQRRREPARHRRRVDHMPRFAATIGLEHARQEVLHAVHHAHQVHAEHPLPVLLGAFPDVTAAGDAGVVHQQMHVAELRERAIGEMRHLPADGDVDHFADHGDAAFAQLVDDRVERVALHVSEDQPHPLSRGPTARTRGRSRRPAPVMTATLSLRSSIESFFQIDAECIAGRLTIAVCRNVRGWDRYLRSGMSIARGAVRFRPASPAACRSSRRAAFRGRPAGRSRCRWRSVRGT